MKMDLFLPKKMPKIIDSFITFDSIIKFNFVYSDIEKSLEEVLHEKRDFSSKDKPLCFEWIVNLKNVLVLMHFM